MEIKICISDQTKIMTQRFPENLGLNFNTSLNNLYLNTKIVSGEFGKVKIFGI